MRNSGKSSASATCSKSARASSTTRSEGSSVDDLRHDPLDVRPRHTVVAHPLPDLRAGDLGGRSVLHQVVDRRRSDTRQPGRDVADPDGDVRAHALLGDLARRRDDVQQVGGLGGDILALSLELVRLLAERRVEDLLRDRNEIRVRDPRAVESVSRLSHLVLANLRQRDLVHLGITPARDERGHAADRVRAARVTRADEKLGVRAHERHGHRHLEAIREHEVVSVSELLDHREDVVPTAGVQPGRVVAQLVQDLLHLERRQDRLDEDRRLDRPLRQPQAVLREAEDVVPEPRLEVALELREVEVRAGSALEQARRVPREVDAEVEQARGDGPEVHLHVLLGEMPAARPTRSTATSSFSA